MAVVYCNAPLEIMVRGPLIDGVADKRKLVTIGWCGRRTHHMMEVDRIASDLIRAYVRNSPIGVESRAIERVVCGSPQIPERHVSNVHVSPIGKPGVAPRS